MKTTLKFGFAVIIFASTLLSSCGKYSDGPKISLKTKTARITREWQDPSCATCGTIEYKKDGTIASNGTTMANYTWKFSSDKESLEETFAMGGISTTATAKILRLTSKDLWLQNASGSTVNKYTAK
jgi:major membrane immunogen (membrane-anchored lipoprotein)